MSHKHSPLVHTDDSDDAGFIPSALKSPTATFIPSSSTGGGGGSSSSGNNYSSLSGGPRAPTANLDTLDESVGDTIKRDLGNIGKKLLQVAVPTANKTILNDWDLWGPLLFCLLLAILLGIAQPQKADTLFGLVFVIVWLGAAVVTVNGQLLGGKLTFFQSVCVLGYCMSPLVVGCLLCLLIPIGFIKPVFLALSWFWACRAAVGFLSIEGFQKRKLLALYPICLFYFILGWMVLVSTTSTSGDSVSTPAATPSSPTSGTV